MTLSVCIITYNEEANIGRTLASVKELVRALDGEIIVVDSGSTDRTREIAESYGAKMFVEEWKGFAAQKNSAIEKASREWILLLDADEEVSEGLAEVISGELDNSNQPPRPPECGAFNGFWINRRNLFLGRWIQFGGFYPDRKLRLFRRGTGRIKPVAVHEVPEVEGRTIAFDELWSGQSEADLIHHAYPTLDIYLEHMRRYADLGAEIIRHKPRPVLLLNRWFNPPLTFLYNYVFRLGFLDGREGFLLHWNHSRYVSWKYAKAWQLSRTNSRAE